MLRNAWVARPGSCARWNILATTRFCHARHAAPIETLSGRISPPISSILPLLLPPRLAHMMYWKIYDFLLKDYIINGKTFGGEEVARTGKGAVLDREGGNSAPQFKVAFNWWIKMERGTHDGGMFHANKGGSMATPMDAPLCPPPFPCIATWIGKSGTM